MNYNRWFLAVLIMATVFAILPSRAVAQLRQGNPIEGLLRVFVQGELVRDRQLALQRQQQFERQRQWQGVQPPVNPPPRNFVSPQLQNYRTVLGYFATQSAALADGLQQSSVRGVRPLIADALTLKATAALMHAQSQKSNDMALLREEYRILDRKWRELSFQFQQLRGVEPRTLNYVRTLDGYADYFEKLLELEPQFDREAVIGLMIENKAHLGTLLDDIQYELYGLPNAEPLVGECRGLVEQCRRFSGIASRASYDDLITKCSAFISDWRKFAAKLYEYKNSYCDRSIRRIRAANQQIFEKLKKPLPIDRDYLGYVSHSLKDEVDLLFENMTVKALVQMPAAQQQSVLKTARDLFGNCQRYCARVQDNAPLNDLMNDYITIGNQWNELNRYLNPITSKAVVTRQRLIAAYDNELRGILRVPAGLDRGRAIQLAASLEELASNMRYDVRRFGRYMNRNPAFRDQAYQSSDAFLADAKQVHAQLQQGTNVDDLRSSCLTAVTNWEAFSNNITAMPQNGVSGSRFQFMNETRQELLPVIAELATLLNV